LNRIKQYGNNTSIICVIGSNNALATEKQLISAFNSRFEKFIGKEYFIIEDIQNAKNIFYNVCNLEDKIDSNLEENSDFNLEYKIDSNLEEKSDFNLEYKIDSNLEEKSDFNLEYKIDSNLEEKSVVKTSVNLNVNEKIGLNMDESKKTIYSCLICNYATKRKYNYDCHLLTKRHKTKLGCDLDKEYIDGDIKGNIFVCKECKYETHMKSNYNRHVKSKRHLQILNNDKINTKPILQCPFCNKQINSRITLWRHKKKCTAAEKTQNPDSNSDSDADFYSESEAEENASEKESTGLKFTENMFYEILNSNKQLMNIVEKGTNKKYCAKCVDR
jgi:hypothetical protein